MRHPFINRILTTATAILDEVQGTTVSVLPGGVHEYFVEALRPGEDGMMVYKRVSQTVEIVYCTVYARTGTCMRDPDVRVRCTKYLATFLV
jgi:hypothetical protein